MYGLMRTGICSRHRERAYQRRLHYCGTCKTMGRLYGQKSRFLLNNDAVFLAELLSALTPGCAPLTDWSRSFQSYNCFSLPGGPDEMPLALQVAATATLVMSEFKVADQLDDCGSGTWKLAQRVYSQSFCDASRRMTEWGFPLAQMWERYRDQRPREAAALRIGDERGAIQALETVAEPTATVTGWTFEHGARVVGAADETREAMFVLGAAFGRLVYVLDALDDYDADLKKGEFNALQAAFRLRAVTTDSDAPPVSGPPDSCRATAEAYLWELAGEAARAIESLPLPAALAALFTSRLNTNLARRLTPSQPATEPTTSLPQRLFRAMRQLWQAARRRPAYALPGGSSAIQLSAAKVPPDRDSQGARTSRKARSCCAGCGDGSCDCCAIACCDGGCECCAEGGCAACEGAGCCCEGAGSCGECGGSCGSCCVL